MISPALLSASLVLGFVVLMLTLGWFEVGRTNLAERLMAAGAPLIDVDPPEVFAHRHPKDALNVPLDKLREGVRGFDRRKPVVVYGHSLRARRATKELHALGFDNVVDLFAGRVEE